jgi:integrase
LNSAHVIPLTRRSAADPVIPSIDRTGNLYCLRHTFASRSVMGGLSLPQVGAVLGHRSAQTALCYADHVLDAVRGYTIRPRTEGDEQTKLTIKASHAICRTGRVYCVVIGVEGE